jgi:hypothetical protein
MKFEETLLEETLTQRIDEVEDMIGPRRTQMIAGACMKSESSVDRGMASSESVVTSGDDARRCSARLPLLLSQRIATP